METLDMYSYKIVERALARRHQVTQDNWSAFRGRIQHLQRLGIVPASPGRGKRIIYTFEDVAKWAFALELEEVGVDPAVIKKLIHIGWHRVRGILVDSDGSDVLLLLSPNLISQRGEFGIFNFNVLEAEDYRELIRSSPSVMQSGPVRCITLNLSWIARDLKHCLKAASDPTDNYPKSLTSYEVLVGPLWADGAQKDR